MKNSTKREKTAEGYLNISGLNGFVKPTAEYAEEFDEIYISPDKLGRAFDGDKVIVSVSLPVIRGRKPEGRIEGIIQQGPRIYAGSVRNKGGKLVFENDGKKRRIFETAEITGDTLNAQEGYSVTFLLEKYNVRNGYYSGHIEKVIGNTDDAGVDITTILAGYGIENVFPDEVLTELEGIPDKLTGQSAASKIKKGRMDLRELQMVTIDSEDTKDVDDAVSVTKNRDGSYVLGVHIADVTEYVTEGSALDREAYRRGTSVYPVDRVVPMLPPKLSNGICSLNAGENRLALSVLMNYDAEGKMTSSRIFESVIKVDDKITYKQLYMLLEEKDAELAEKYASMLEMFENMRKLASMMRAHRREKGAIDFDFPEIKVELGPDGKPVSVGKYEKTFTNDIIEEFMVAANMAVSEYFCTKKMPFMYRVHEEPEREKIERLARTVKSAGGTAVLPKGKITPGCVSRMLASVKGKPGENAVSYLALRSLQKAEYRAECLGHFGLAAEYYSHFTSPIRRYPDLFIHRIIKKVLRGEMNPTAKRHFEEIKEEAAENCSVTERRAAEAEMSVRDFKVIQYMEQFEGSSFEGEISSVTDFGFYVRLDNMAEGLVHYNTVSDYMEFDEINMCARGRRTGITFYPGMKVKIVVAKADPDARQLDFILDTDKGPGAGRKKLPEREGSKHYAVKKASRPSEGRNAKKYSRKESGKHGNGGGTHKSFSKGQKGSTGRKKKQDTSYNKFIFKGDESNV